MAAWMTIEEESGTSQYSTHTHNGYYAGDFTQTQPEVATSRSGDGLVAHDLVLVSGERLRLW